MFIVENIVRTFVVDTLICSKDCEHELRRYMMDKHGWSFETWNNYLKIYVDHLDRVGLMPEEKSEISDKKV